MSDTYKRSIKLLPAQDIDYLYGAKDVKLIMILSGEDGAVHFELNTGWYLPHICEEFMSHCKIRQSCPLEPLPITVMYHSLTPIGGDNEFFEESCKYLDGKSCYYSSSLVAEANRVFEVLLTEGDQGVWRELKAFYEKNFAENKK